MFDLGEWEDLRRDFEVRGYKLVRQRNALREPYHRLLSHASKRCSRKHKVHTAAIIEVANPVNPDNERQITRGAIVRAGCPAFDHIAQRGGADGDLNFSNFAVAPLSTCDLT